jgi:hypothetical protein
VNLITFSGNLIAKKKPKIIEILNLVSIIIFSCKNRQNLTQPLNNKEFELPK